MILGVFQRLGLVLVACGAADLAAAAPRDHGPDSEPTLMQTAPADGARVEESNGWLEVQASPDLHDVCIVVAHRAFDPSTWSALPEGSEWIIARDVRGAVDVADLGISARTETPLWWAATGRDARTGTFRVTPVRRFILAPKFANRAAPDAHIEPTSTGWLPAEKAAAEEKAAQPIWLAAGYTLVPGAGSPRVAVDLARASDDMHAALRRKTNSRGAYLVRFSSLSPELARGRVVRAGGTIVASLPGGSLLVRMEASQRDVVAADLGLPWVESWEPAYKISRHIDRAAAGRTALTALVFPDGDADAVAAALGALGASAVSVHRNGINQLLRFELEGARVADAAALADVTWIEPTPRDSTLNNEAQWVVQTNMPDSRRVWDSGLRGQGQVLMTSDSGIRTNHEMFFDPAHDITDFGDFPLHRKIIAYRRGSDHELVEFGDEAGSSYHGTHTAGTVVGNNDPTTTNPYDGMAKDAKLYFMDLAGTYSNGSIAPPADLNDLFLPSYNGNAGGAARISSNSWGAYTAADYTLSSMQVDQFMWNHPDYLILYANGNYGVNVSAVTSPATAKNCISVGGTGNGAERQSLYAYTSRGPTNDVRRKPTIAAPGDLVASSVGTTRYAYSYSSGTSMATPTAAGALALVRQYLTEGWYPTGAPVAAHAFTPSAALLKAMAVNSGENDVTNAFVPDNKVGWGRINIDNVLYFPGDQRRVLLIDAADGLMHRQFVEYQIQVGGPTQPFSVSLCWTDAPGNPVVIPQLVNDLDLVVSNGTQTYLGNRMFNGVSLVGAGRDSLNVEECVRVPTPAAGVWTVRVEGYRVLEGPQPYALCITGGVGQGMGSLALERYDYSLADTLAIEVVDTNASGPLSVTVSSPTDEFGETVQLHGDAGVFRGSLAIAPSVPNPNDHRLAVSSGDAITVTYADVAPPASVSATARVNAMAPVITDVHAEPLSGTTARITWTTDILSTSFVQFGENGVLGRTQETSGYTHHHEVRLSGLQPTRTYEYDVVSVTRNGASARDNFGGMHRTFTTKPTGHIALVLNDVPAPVLPTWLNAIDALGWDVDVFTGSDVEPPLVGNKSVGLRSYSCVLWQVGTDDYPPFSDAQCAAIDSLLEGGARVLVTGHDIGYGMADASVFSYTPEREAWLERGLKTRYYYDELNGISTILGTSDDPISGGYGAGIPYYQVRRGSTSDLVGAAPGTDGQGTVNWLLNASPAWPCGLRWESHAPKGRSLDAFWGGQRSRLAVLYFEWAGLATNNAAPAMARTDVLEKSVAWLLGRRPPSVTITAPLPGAVVTSDVVPIRYSIAADAGHGIATRSISGSLDGGETWTLLSSSATHDSTFLWDVGATLGGTPTPNSTRVLLRVGASDDGAPPLSGRDVMDAVFTIARPGGDALGPIVVAGSLRITPTPVRGSNPATLQATFSDAASGGGSIAAAEYSWGTAPAAAGTGTPMTVTPTPSGADVHTTLPPNSLPLGPVTMWVRAQDTAERWGPAASLRVVVNVDERTDTAEIPLTNYVTGVPAGRGAASIHFGLARAAEIRLDLFDVRGRRVRSLAMGRFGAGAHVASWDGRDDTGALASSGMFFVRLAVAQDTYTTRLVHFR